MVNTYVQIIGVPLATIWCSGVNWGADGAAHKATTSVTLPRIIQGPGLLSTIGGSLHTKSSNTKGDGRGEMSDMAQRDRIRMDLGHEPLVSAGSMIGGTPC